MVREWGMSERIGPMAWGTQGPVFLGEDLVHTRDYSDETARVIDEEVERILREEESPGPARARGCTAAVSTRVAKALLEHETLDGDEVAPPRRRGDGPQGRRLPQGPQGRRHHHGGQGARRERQRRSKKAGAAKRVDRATGTD